jgi:hypothetical protein
LNAHLYISADLLHFQADAGERLAYDVTQTDEDQVRAYRRADRYWWAWLARQHQASARLAELRALLVAEHGEDRVAAGEATVLGWGYRPPAIRLRPDQCFCYPLPPFVPPTQLEAA